MNEIQSRNAQHTAEGDVIVDAVQGRSEERKGVGLKVLPLRTATPNAAMRYDN